MVLSLKCYRSWKNGSLQLNRVRKWLQRKQTAVYWFHMFQKSKLQIRKSHKLTFSYVLEFSSALLNYIWKSECVLAIFDAKLWRMEVLSCFIKILLLTELPPWGSLLLLDMNYDRPALNSVPQEILVASNPIKAFVLAQCMKSSVWFI